MSISDGELPASSAGIAGSLSFLSMDLALLPNHRTASPSLMRLPRLVITPARPAATVSSASRPLVPFHHRGDA